MAPQPPAGSDSNLRRLRRAIARLNIWPPHCRRQMALLPEIDLRSTQADRSREQLAV
jgi:hypothetical protein